MPPGGAPPGMMGMASAGVSKQDASPQDIREAILAVSRAQLAKQSASPDLGNREESTAGSGVPSPQDLVEDPDPSSGKNNGIDPSGKERRKVDSTLGSTAAAHGAEVDKVENFKAEKKDAQVDTSTSNPGDKGLLSSNEPVKSGFEGNMAPSSAQDGATPGGEGAVEGTIEAKLSALRDSYRELNRYREPEGRPGKQRSSLRDDVRGLFGKQSGETSGVEEFVESFLRERGQAPSVADVVKETGASHEVAQAAISTVAGTQGV